MNEYKTCTKCGQTQSTNNFYRQKSTKDGFRTWCKSCFARANKQWLADHPGQSAKYSKKWQENNPEKSIQSSQSWKARNKEKIKSYNQIYSKQNASKINELNRNWAKRNPEWCRANNAKRRALKSNAKTFAISAKEIARLYQTPCFMCGSNNQIELDHIIPLSRGGDHSIGNLLSLCKSCNASKHNSLWMEWRIRLSDCP